MKRTKRLGALLVAVIMMLTVAASAAPNLQTRSSAGNIFSANYGYDFNLDTGLLTYSASVVGFPGVESTYVASVIQRKMNGQWVNVPGSFRSQTSSNTYATVGTKQYVVKGYWYRTQNTYIATKGGVQTREVFNSGMKWYND